MTELLERSPHVRRLIWAALVVLALPSLPGLLKTIALIVKGTP